MEFTTVYILQAKLAKQKTLLEEKGKEITESEVKRQIRTAYLQMQYTIQRSENSKVQDSLYSIIATAADRQYLAGQIDFVAKTYAVSRYGEVHNQFVQAQSDAQLSLMRLQLYTGIEDSIITTPFTKINKMNFMPDMAFDSSINSTSPLVHYYEQTQYVAKKTWQLEKNKLFPGFMIGYMNQGARSTDIPMRLRAGINIPIWFWQYSAAIRAAKSNLKIEEQNQLLQLQNLEADFQQSKSELLKNSTLLDYYEVTGLQLADELIRSSARMFTAGQTDYITYLRTLSDANSVRVNYLETLRNYNQSIINLQYLNGQ